MTSAAAVVQVKPNKQAMQKLEIDDQEDEDEDENYISNNNEEIKSSERYAAGGGTADYTHGGQSNHGGGM